MSYLGSASRQSLLGNESDDSFRLETRHVASILPKSTSSLSFLVMGWMEWPYGALLYRIWARGCFSGAVRRLRLPIKQILNPSYQDIWEQWLQPVAINLKATFLDTRNMT